MGHKVMKGRNVRDFPYVTVFPRASSVYLLQHGYEEAQCTFAWHRVSEVNENPAKNINGGRKAGEECRGVTAG